MDREGFRNRLKQYKKAREENPGLKYWEWKSIPKYDEGGKVIPTQEEYIAEQIAARKAAALEKSLSRTMPRVPQGIKIGERWNPVTKKVEDIHECGPSCAYTFSDNYGQNWMGSEDFKQNHANYGWKQVPWEQRQPGNAVLIVDDSGTAKHTMMYDSDNAQGQPLFNHSNGGHDESAIRKKAKYPHHNPYLTYEFVGTPADSTQWINDYKKIYGFAEGGEVLEQYYAPKTVEGILAKTAIQLADPTGVSSYPDVWYSGKKFLNSPSWSNLKDVGINTLSALPLIGKVTAPFKAAKMAKLLAHIEDANALVKGVENANRLNKVIDTVSELLPVVRRGAEKVQDVTSALVTNPIFDYMTNRNKFDLVRNYRNMNAAVDAVNISNNTADVAQGIESLIGYSEGGEVEPDPLEVLERSKPKVAGIPINDKPLSGTDPIGEAMMWGLGGGAASVALRSLFPTYGATAGWLAFGDNNKENVLIVPNNVNKSKLPVAKDLVNYDVKEFFENDVVPRDVIYPIESKQSFLNDANFMYDIYPESHFEQNVAGYYDNINKKVVVNNLYAGDQKSINRIGTHEFGHKYNDQFELDDPHKRILNNAYTVEENKIGRTARGARRTNEKRETNKNIRYDMYVELQEKLGRSPSPSEVDDFIDSLSDREILRRVRNSNMYGSAYFESINERAQRIKQPIGTYTRTRASKIRKALKQVAMNERSKDNQNYA